MSASDGGRIKEPQSGDRAISASCGLSVCGGGGGGGAEVYLQRANPPAKLAVADQQEALSTAWNAPKKHADDVISSATCLYVVPLFSFVLFFAGSN
ncbi:hypothetical protein MUK42_37655 [Musa troglodytarum]|uniref:Uncharacterized protein n=1 Tax=Musa troglodytarum TaxID=320322 RepID=A0A9E7J958_9LILI|nr:hypothetical protein MUK42_37655 [Musa troglodytarum]